MKSLFYLVTESPLNRTVKMHTVGWPARFKSNSDCK